MAAVGSWNHFTGASPSEYKMEFNIPDCGSKIHFHTKAAIAEGITQGNPRIVRNARFPNTSFSSTRANIIPEASEIIVTPAVYMKVFNSAFQNFSDKNISL